MADIMAKGAISNLLNKIFNAFLGSLNNLFTDAASTKDSYEKGKYVITTTENVKLQDANGNPIRNAKATIDVILQWPKNTIVSRKDAISIANNNETWTDAEKLSLEMTFKNSNKVTKSDITPRQINQEIQKYIDKYDLMNTASERVYSLIFLFTEGDIADSAKQLKFSLKKVQGNKELELTKITANYDAKTVLDDIDIIMNDPDFIDQNFLNSENELSYEVQINDNDYDVNICDPFDCTSIIQIIFNMTFQYISELQIIKLSTVGPSGKQISEICTDLIIELETILDILSDILYNIGCTYLKGFHLYVDGINYNQENILEKIKNKMYTYQNYAMIANINCDEDTRIDMNSCIDNIDTILSYLH